MEFKDVDPDGFGAAALVRGPRINRVSDFMIAEKAT